jgi:hypothetical protein
LLELLIQAFMMTRINRTKVGIVCALCEVKQSNGMKNHVCVCVRERERWHLLGLKLPTRDFRKCWKAETIRRRGQPAFNPMGVISYPFRANTSDHHRPIIGHVACEVSVGTHTYNTHNQLDAHTIIVQCYIFHTMHVPIAP